MTAPMTRLKNGAGHPISREIAIKHQALTRAKLVSVPVSRNLLGCYLQEFKIRNGSRRSMLAAVLSDIEPLAYGRYDLCLRVSLATLDVS
jgi:hypothetical protein